MTDSFRHLYREHIKPKLASSGTINRSSNPVHWSKLKGVPGGLADGSDATGVRGYEIAVDSASVPPASNYDMFVECPDDKRVLSGGVSSLQSNGSYDALVRVLQSYPLDDYPLYSGWVGAVHNARNTASDIQVHAICVKA